MLPDERLRVLVLVGLAPGLIRGLLQARSALGGSRFALALDSLVRDNLVSLQDRRDGNTFRTSVYPTPSGLRQLAVLADAPPPAAEASQ